MDFNDLIVDEGLADQKILVLRHRPKERELSKVMPWLAEENPAAYNAYQQTQSRRVEKQMQRAEYVASFIGHEAGKALFVGLYEQRGYKKKNATALKRLPQNQELCKYGFSFDDARSDTLWFDLALTKVLSKWKGKLIVRWPPPEIAWSRWASNNEFDVEAILEESCLAGRMPEWRDLVLTWDELHAIPTSWRNRLSQWRGLYFILDTSDGKGYVGSAYGKDNLLGRWLAYSKSGHGGNKLLRKRKPQDLQFSILERVSPDMAADEIVGRENTWKSRLHTRDYGLNDN